MSSAMAVATTTLGQDSDPTLPASNMQFDTAGLATLRPQQLVALADRHVRAETRQPNYSPSSERPPAYATRTDTDAVEDLRGPAVLINFPEFTPVRTLPHAFVVLAEWEGSVLTIETDRMTTQLTPISGVEGGGQSEAEIPCDEISEDDRELVRIGALFRLAVGYEIANGTRTRFSRIVFRRLPAWTRRDIEEADALAEKYFDGNNVE